MVPVADFLGIALPEGLFPENVFSIHRILAREDIEGLIPERGRALFANKAVILQSSGRSGIEFTAVMRVDVDATFCDGHMPGFPILPLGVGGWMLSQAGEILVAYAHNYRGLHSQQHNVPLVVETGPVQSKNRDFIIPGDSLLLVANEKRHRLTFYEVDTEAWLLDQQVVAVPDMKYAVVTMEQFMGRYPKHARIEQMV